MFMYMFHIAFGIGLMALVMGLSMCKCCCHGGTCEGKCGGSCRKWAGAIISILAIISLGCTVMTGYKQMNSGMMDKDMGHMKNMMKDMKKNAGMDDKPE